MLRLFSTITIVCFALPSFAKPSVSLSLKMTVGADFIANSAVVKGYAKEVDGKFIAENISVPVATLDAGLSTRTKHMQDTYLEKDKYPEVKLIKAEGSKGQGTGIIEIHGVQKPISGTYKIEKGELEATFIVKIPEYNIAKVKYMGVGVKDDVKVVVRVPVKK